MHIAKGSSAQTVDLAQNIFGVDDAEDVLVVLAATGGYALGADGKTSSQRTAELHAITHRVAKAVREGA